MRSFQEVRHVEDLVAAGLNDCAISRLTGLPRTTVRDWRRTYRWTSVDACRLRPDTCDACGHPSHRFDELSDQYVYLLGLYLGDGYIVHHRRGVFRLTITLDARYPGIVTECREAITSVMPAGRVGLQFRFGGTCAWVTNSSKQWPCLIPQHGTGRKHQRPIQLTEWQTGLVEKYPREFLRGLIHSDGCRFINMIRHGDMTYEYPGYNFSNRSDDIRQMFVFACDLLGIEWRAMGRWQLSVARRASVALLDEFIGPKA